MTSKMTAQDLIDTYTEKWGAMTSTQRSAFKGNVTWMWKRTSDASEVEKLRYLAGEIQMPLPNHDTSATPQHSFVVPIYTIKLVRDNSNSAISDRKRVTSPADIANVLMPFIQNEDREHLVVMMLDSKNRIIGINTVAIGSLNSAYVSAREVFKPAILANAAVIILAHNHPSGDATPSPDDVQCTRRMVEAGKLLEIDVLDHIIIGENRWVSMKERGLGFS